MGSMLDMVSVTQQFLQTLIDIIGRKTSQEYAAVTIRNFVKKLQLTYPFLQKIKIKNTYSLEFETGVEIDESLNTVDPKKIGMALKDLTKIIMQLMGKTAGYFFIRETREKIGIDYDTVLVKTMDVDLTMMQSTYIVEKKSMSLLAIEKTDVMRRFLMCLIEVLETQTSKTYAINFVKQHVESLRQRYRFLENITINDIRYTLGSDEVRVTQEINDVDSHDLGNAIRSILYDTDKVLTDHGRNSVVSDLKTHLTAEYLTKLEEMGVAIISQGIGYDAMFKQTIKALIDVIGKISTETYAIFVVNANLKKLVTTYQFLDNIRVKEAANESELYHITITDNIDSISETDARRAIQHLLESLLAALGETVREEFIQKFKDSLDRKYLSAIEELGVNFHMIELHQEMGIKTG
jgi:hypothetical protein